ncbi:hypothetical protein BC936DRAFT_146728 [Jimgerdemannia flammicorona]|uniref:Ion transport domain-containing protein n=1 Tax=Jimgerdemannia flammicorona TaxID=994334 RepID=A0A433D6W2_9FUNG|nr:hypothetical protein BC936DRAFT_146728 [Jimgerdemannia flammicorona]
MADQSDLTLSVTTLDTKATRNLSEQDLEMQPEDIDIEVEVKAAVKSVIQTKDYTHGGDLTKALVKAIDKAPELASSALRELSYVKLPADNIKNDDSSDPKFTELENFHPCIFDPEFKNWEPMKDSYIDMFVKNIDIFNLADRKNRRYSLCIVPLYDFSKYETTTNSWRKQFSPFTKFAHSKNSDFAEPVLEAVVKFKWRSFARTRYWLNFALFLTYFAVFAAMIGRHIGPDAGDITTIVLGVYFILQEFRLLIVGPVSYLTCTYNYTDVATIGFPIGILVIVIYSILQHIWPFIFIASAFLLAFAHAFLVLLHHVAPSNGASPYIGNLTDTSGAVADTISLNAPSYNASTGAFYQWDSAVPSIIYFLGGDWSSLSAYDPSPYRTVLKCVFTFMITIGILNVSIALLNDIFSRTYANGQREWVIMMAETVSRVEYLLMLPMEHKETKIFPEKIAYIAHDSEILRYNDAKEKDKAQVYPSDWFNGKKN